MPKIAQVKSISMDFLVENASLLHTPYYCETSVLAFEQRSLIKYFPRCDNFVRQDTCNGETNYTSVSCWYEIDGSIEFINLRSDSTNTRNCKNKKKINNYLVP